MIVFTKFLKIVLAVTLFALSVSKGVASESQVVIAKEKIETLLLDILSYDDFILNSPQALTLINKALNEKGIVGIKGIPGYKEKVRTFIERSRAFTALSDDVKKCYAPNRDLGELVGFESKEVDLKTAFLDLGELMTQMGEFAQRVTNDAIRATEHRVHKAEGAIERYTMALFFDAPMDTVIHSSSELTRDERYRTGALCSYGQWSEASFKLYLVKDEEEWMSKK